TPRRIRARSQEGHGARGGRISRDPGDLAPAHPGATGSRGCDRGRAERRPPPRLASVQMRVLLTNDDGIEAAGLQALRRALLPLPGIELVVIAPDGNRSAMALSTTTSRPLWVQEVDFRDGTIGWASYGTPVERV